PDTLRKLASANETGMTIIESFDMVAKNSKGILAEELKKVHNEIRWNGDLNDAMVGFANRLKIPRLSRTVKLITKANESSGDIRNVLEVAARDADNSYKLDKDRFQEMIIYTVIIIISFLVFLFVIVVLENMFLTKIAEAGQSMSESGGGGELQGSALSFQSINLELFRMLFFHAAVIQAYVSGLLAGQMGEDDMLSGLKYGIVLTLVATVVFLFI
ncbi:MAG: type II secretion system F family protein, partial [Halobacteria archaeon]|nr:type II secretion system F family protein [Halobacteria archaeon]